MTLYTTGSPAADVWLGTMGVIVVVLWLLVAVLVWEVVRKPNRRP